MVCSQAKSMFYEESGASKLCLVSLILHARDLGFSWIDCQQISPLLESFGAKLIDREEFLEILQKSLKQKFKLTQCGQFKPFTLKTSRVELSGYE